MSVIEDPQDGKVISSLLKREQTENAQSDIITLRVFTKCPEVDAKDPIGRSNSPAQ